MKIIHTSAVQKSIYFAFIILFSCMSFSQAKHKDFILKISNNLPINREHETIELTKEILGVENLSKLKNFGIKEMESDRFLEIQFVDQDQDGEMDVLLFQPEIKALSTKKYILFYQNDSLQNPVINCYSRFVPERTDDYAWENDKVAFRTYGPVAQQMIENNIPGGTLTSGIDAWLKRVEYPIINKWYKKATNGTGTYHKDTGEGLDNFHVGNSRGIGGIAVKVNNQYYFSKNFISWKTITTGPIRTNFVLTYADWDANGKKITESKKISLDYGNYLSKFEITVSGTKQIAAGITLHDQKGSIGTNIKEGWLSYWEPIEDSEIGMGIVVPKKQMTSFDHFITSEKDLSNLYGNLKVKNSKAMYYAGFGWKKGSPFQNKQQWETYLSSFAQKINNPLIVEVIK